MRVLSLHVSGLVLALVGFAACAQSSTTTGSLGVEGPSGSTAAGTGGGGGESTTSSPTSTTGGQGASSTTSSSTSSSGTGGQGTTSTSASSSSSGTSGTGGQTTAASSTASTSASTTTSASSSSSSSGASGTGGQATTTSSSASGTGGGGVLGYTFANPLQVDLSQFFNSDTVANSSANGQSYPPLVSMDGSGYDYFTEAVAENDFFDFGDGLPNDGLFASDSDHPDVQLAFSDTSVGPISFILNAPNPKILTVTIPVVATSYSTVQIYGTSTEGSSSLTVTLNYSDGSTGVTTFTVPDWGQSYAAAAPAFVVQDGLARFSMSGGDEYNPSFALYGATAQASSAKTLQSFTITTTGSGRFVLYGATAY